MGCEFCHFEIKILESGKVQWRDRCFFGKTGIGVLLKEEPFP